MLDRKDIIFRGGICFNNPSLKVLGDDILHLSHSSSNEPMLLKATMSKKEMHVFSMSQTGVWQRIDKDSDVRFGIIDLSISGSRWEGYCVAGKPFGYGMLFDDDNILIYKGFLYDSSRVCYGISYYEKTGLLEYDGNYCKNLKHGYGSCYSMRGDCIYNGVWINDKPASVSTVHTPMYCEDLFTVDSLVEEIVIGENSYSSTNFLEFILTDYYFLRKLQIASDCFMHTNRFVIQGLPLLEVVEVANDCFCDSNDGCCTISNCGSLKTVCVGDHSFHCYSVFRVDSILD